MKGNGLTRLYDRLSIRERIPLLVAAHNREDDVEYQRLFHASPVRTWHFPEHMLAEEMLHVLALNYVSEQLDAAAVYFFAREQAAHEDEPKPDDWLLAIATSAYIFAVNADAWRRLCSEQGIAPEALVAANYRGSFLPICEENLTAEAPTHDALHAMYRECGRELGKLVTADDRLKDWQARLQEVTHDSPTGAQGKQR
jgi:hypothetical protein